MEDKKVVSTGEVPPAGEANDIGGDEEEEQRAE